MAGGEGGRPNLFQFWNTERAPDDVESLMRTWSEDPAFHYQRFNAETASVFIEENFDRQALDAYRRCGVPAMQADFFRYCVLYVHGGVYVDAGTEQVGPLASYLEHFASAVLMQRVPRNILPNGFMFFRRPGAPLLERILSFAIANIEKRISNNVWMVTGPGIQSRLYFSGQHEDLFADVDIVPMSEVLKYAKFHHRLSHKAAETDWRHHIETGKSIFVD
jgi:mannosyltransferase OCH1-like enzyme